MEVIFFETQCIHIYITFYALTMSTNSDKSARSMDRLNSEVVYSFLTYWKIVAGAAKAEKSAFSMGFKISDFLRFKDFRVSVLPYVIPKTFFYCVETKAIVIVFSF